MAAVLPLAPPDELLPNISKSEPPNSNVWNISPLNPKNQVDTLVSAIGFTTLIQWRLSGCFGNGRQFYTYPRFAIGRPPLHIDVYIPDQRQHPHALRLLLQSGATMKCPSSQVANLGISRHVLHGLTVWSSHIPNFERKYLSLPFRSRIVVQNIASDVHNIQISMAPNVSLTTNCCP